ncbi:MAG: aminoacyltransferase [Oscillospiraceae bacterium]|nr:aminoacyltransferase [Oscillospiraceae bacterium]
MYSFKKEENFALHDQFICQNGGQYIQSSRWAKVKDSWKSTVYAGFLEGERVLAVLVMERKMPLAAKIWYAPSGFVGDYENTPLLEEFTRFIRKRMKKYGVTAFIMDPPISLRVNGALQERGKEIHKKLVDTGFSLNHNIENYTYKHPVQLFIALGENIDSLVKKFDKGVRYSIRLGDSRGLRVASFAYQELKDDPKPLRDFMEVMADTAERDNFVERNESYCLTLLREFEGYSDLKLVYYDKKLDQKIQDTRQKERDKLEKSLENANEKRTRAINEQICALDRQSEQFRKRQIEANACTDENAICVAGGLSIYYSSMGSCLFGGTKNVLRTATRSSHYLNFLRIQESQKRGMALHDLGYVLVDAAPPGVDGILGELCPAENFKGIYDFKKSFASDYHQFIGEYVLRGKPLRYWAYAALMPRAKTLKVRLYKLLKR